MNKPRPRAPGKPLKHKIALSITSYSKQDQSEVQNMVLGMLIRDVVATNSPACCLQGHEGQCWPLPPRCCSHPSPRCLLQSSPPPNEASSSAARGSRSSPPPPRLLTGLQIGPAAAVVTAAPAHGVHREQHLRVPPHGGLDLGHRVRLRIGGVAGCASRGLGAGRGGARRDAGRGLPDSGERDRDRDLDL